MYREAYGGPDQPTDSGHTFVSNTLAGVAWYTETDAIARIARVREDIELRVATLARYLDPGDPLYFDPLVSPRKREEMDQYQIAKFNYDFVAADGSYGSHNAIYARAVLSEAESFFGIAP